MAIYNLARVIEDVRVALDHNSVSSTLIEDVTTLSFNEIVESKVVEGVKRVHSSAPSYLLVGGNNFGDAIYWQALDCGYVLLPQDFMRLICFEMSDWEQAVYDALGTDSPQYKLQSSRYKGLRGTSQKPLCFLSVRPEGRVLEFYSTKNQEAHVIRGMYVPYPKIDEHKGIDISEPCYDAVIYTIAALVLTAINEPEKSGIFLELAKTTLV